MISKAKSLIQAVLNRFYTVHHDKDTFETELEFEVQQSRVRAFSETKHRITDVIDFRINTLTSVLNLTKGLEIQADYSARLDELETLRSYIKGMVIKVDE